MRKYILFAFLFLIQMYSVHAEGTVNVLTFGAVADGKTLNTQNIQSAIDAVNRNGGGTVVFPKGRFLSGSIILKSNVKLYLEKGAVLLGTTDPFQYIKINRSHALILADRQENLSITGEGIIDGQGRELALKVDSLYYAGVIDGTFYNLRRKRPNEQLRAELIDFVDCKNIRIADVELRNAACWVQCYDRCEGLIFDNLKVISDAYWNNDGFDISDCKNVRITNCFVNAADDGICLKSHSPEVWNDSIYIANCTVRSSASAIKFGTASTGGFKNIKIENIKVYDTFRSAIALESVDGGDLENIEIDGIDAKNTGNAIFIRLGHRNQDDKVGTLRNVSIKNMKVEVPFERPDENYDLRGPDLPFFHNHFPSSIAGIPDHEIENVTLENIEIIFPGRGNRGLAILPVYRLHDVPEQEAEYPEFSMFGELPAWGFYVRHTKGLTLKNITLKALDPDYRPAFVFDDVTGLKLFEIKITEDDNNKQYILKNVVNSNLLVDKQKLQIIE